MSTKASIFLTEDNEHWYHDYIDDCVTIEMSKDNIQEDYSDECDIVLEIKPGSEIYRILQIMRGMSNKNKKAKGVIDE